MSDPAAPSPADNPPGEPSFRAALALRSRAAAAAACLLLATVLAYSNTFGAPFILDDQFDILENPTIRSLWPPGGLFTRMVGGKLTLLTRPVANLTFALNHAIGGFDPRGWHAVNLAIHLGAGLLLYGLVRRALRLPGPAPRSGAAAIGAAWAAALLWSLHPLQTESVTYLTQRYESLMGFFYLLTLYATLRCGEGAGGARAWAGCAIAAAFLAMGCKEVAVSVPIAALLLDRAFLAGTFREAWRHRKGLHCGLMASWGFLALLQSFAASREEWAGLHIRFSPWEYATTQFGVLLHYLRLAAWPSGLVLDHRWPVARAAAEILPGLLVVATLVGLTIYALARHPRLGFLGAVFFMVLAPTSTVLPLGDLAVEHRMYLPLAPLVVLVVLGAERILARPDAPTAIRRWAGAGAAGILALGLGIATHARNALYADPAALWRDNLARTPWNVRVMNNLGLEYLRSGRLREANGQFEAALRLAPDELHTLVNHGLLLERLGDPPGAAGRFEAALRRDPACFEALINLGSLEVRSGNLGRALQLYARARELRPGDPVACLNLGETWLRSGQPAAAVEPLEAALKAQPGNARARRGLEAARSLLR
jgi:tetratricopeptide (TPR) repeat protein